MTDAFTDLQTPAGFLALLWPDATFDGWLTFFAKAPDGKTGTAAFPRSRLAEAHTWVLAQAKTANVWHGVGLRKEKPAKNARGKAEDVIALPGPVVRPGRKRPRPCRRALAGDLRGCPRLPGLAAPQTHGDGLHGRRSATVWLFPEPLRLSTEADWNRAKAVSERWQRCIIARGRERGWKLDNTSDLPRVLRLTGTVQPQDGNARPGDGAGRARGPDCQV